MNTGRNHPLLLGCENSQGDQFEVVVKFRGREMDESAQLAELITAQLAEELGLRSPQVAIVNVPDGFEAVIPKRDAAKAVAGSPGLNFGSVHLGLGFTTWPPGRNPVGAQRDQAADIFAFDALIQNPDRRAINPNLWARSDQLGVYDHEQAFSFLRLQIIGGSPKPWSTANQANDFRFLEQHVFFQSLRGGRLNLGPFEEKLGVLSDEQMQRIIDSSPKEWRGKGDFCARIMDYLRTAREHREALVNFVKHLLR